MNTGLAVANLPTINLVDGFNSLWDSVSTAGGSQLQLILLTPVLGIVQGLLVALGSVLGIGS